MSTDVATQGRHLRGNRPWELFFILNHTSPTIRFTELLEQPLFVCPIIQMRTSAGYLKMLNMVSSPELNKKNTVEYISDAFVN
jgi:hypothetical protein